MSQPSEGAEKQLEMSLARKGDMEIWGSPTHTWFQP